MGMYKSQEHAFEVGLDAKKRLVEMFGDAGWEIRTWENFGWAMSVNLKVGSFGLALHSYQYGDKPRHWSALLGRNGSGQGYYSTSFTSEDPAEVVKDALDVAYRFHEDGINRLDALTEKMENYDNANTDRKGYIFH